MKITFLGTGTSHGVPSIDCMLQNHSHCKKGVCRASLLDCRHYRTRCSMLVEYERYHILFDVSADFRHQALKNHIPKIDAVFITHKHADHIGGMPDIRSYTKDPQKPLAIYGSEESIVSIKQTFDYIFNPGTFAGGGIPLLDCRIIKPLQQILIGDLPVVPLPVTHGNLSGCFGYRFGDLAYIPDLKALNDEILDQLKGLKVLVLNCLRDEREHATHLIMSQSVALARRLASAKTYFVHMCHDIHYEIDGKLLDPNMQFAYDGLTIEA